MMDLQDIIETLKNTTSRDKAKEFMESNGYFQIGAGCESIVFSKKDIGYVIKYQFSPFFNSGSLIDSIPDEEHFAKQTVYRGKSTNVIIQEKCDPDIETLRDHYTSLGLDMYKEFCKWRDWIEDTFKVGDVHSTNVGVKDGKFIVIDWTISNN